MIIKNAQGHDYTEKRLDVQVPQIVDVPCGLIKTILNKHMKEKILK